MRVIFVAGNEVRSKLVGLARLDDESVQSVIQRPQGIRSFG